MATTEPPAPDLPPDGRFGSATEIEAWIDRQTPLLHVVDAAVPACGLGEPRLQVGPKFYRRDGSTPAHLRRGAVWFVPFEGGMRNVGFRVDLFGIGYRLRCWGPRRTMSVDSRLVSTVCLANDLWTALVSADVSTTSELPYLKDGHGGIFQVCRLGCDLQVVRPGRVVCSC
jgi:hypothetical protein